MEKKIIYLGNYYGHAQGHTGSVYFRGGYTTLHMQYWLEKRQSISNQKMEKEILVLGAVGNNERENRDNKRVLNRGGAALHLNLMFQKNRHW